MQVLYQYWFRAMLMSLAQYWKPEKDLDLDLPSTDIDLEFDPGWY